MRKHLSVLMLMARATIYKLLALVFVMGCTQVILFRLALNSALVAASAKLGISALETVISRSRAAWVFAVCFVLTAVLLCLTGCEFGSKQGYTLRRLSVSEQSVFVWQSVYNVCCLFMLWAAQILIAFALCHLYIAEVDPTLTSRQTIFLAFYRNDFLHSLLPLSEVSRWVRNILLVVCLGLAAAQFPYRQRRGKIGVTMIAMTALTLVFFSRGIASLGNDILIILLSAINVVSVLRNVLGRDAYEKA